ncbi:MAG: tyrosine-type recombinase/integrase [Planctomycetes bacterium]|nr:tyrosine-type recombinase/integrase [Planctomycetota bacterium]
MQILRALDLFVGQLQADGRSPHTIGQYRRHVRALGAWLTATRGSLDLRKLRHQDVAAFFGAPAARTAAGTTRAKRATSVNAMRTSIRCFLRYLHESGEIGSNPAALLKRARCAPPPPRAMRDEEEQKLLAYLAGHEGDAARRDEALVRLMLGAGLRIGAALGLDVEDLDLERAEAHVRRDKGDRSETVLLPHQLVEHLRGFVGARRSGPLFATADGERVSTRHAQRRFAAAVAATGIERRLSPHACRHAFATRLLARTGNLQLVRRAMHHRSISSTAIYAAVRDEDVRRALAE